MFCKYCGNKIDVDSVFCKACGRNITAESVTQEPITQVPTYQEPVVQTPVYQEPEQNDIKKPSEYYYGGGFADTMPLDNENKSTSTAKYERMSGYTDSLPPVYHNPSPMVEYKRAPEKPIKEKKKKNLNFLPYIILPIACLISSFFALLVQYLTTGAYDLAMGLLVDSDFMFGTVYYAIRNLIGGIAYTLPYIILIVVASLCCKGIYKKASFIGSFFAGSIGNLIGNVLSVIAGYITLYAVGFYDLKYYAMFTTATGIINLLNIFICPGIAVLWFACSQKYTVKKEEKSNVIHLILPSIAIAVYGLISSVLGIFVYDDLYFAFINMFEGDYNSYFSSILSSTITLTVSYICLFLLALTCRGGYRKVIFIGSIFFSNSILGFIPNVTALIGSIINENWYAPAVTIGQFIQCALAIAIAILIFILLNKHAVVKLKKKSKC